jgi:hypothetical protein
MKMKQKWLAKVTILRTTFSLVICFLFSFCVFSPSAMSQSGSMGQRDNPNQRLAGIKLGGHHPPSALGSTSDPKDDSSDVRVEFVSAYPGSKNFLVTIWLKNPVNLAGFDFEIIITPPELVDFSTVRMYVDSIDTCPSSDTVCWYYFPVRDCLAVPGPEITQWPLAAHGAPQDTTQFFSDTVWMLGFTLIGPYLFPHPNYVPLLQFGVDVSCVPDSLTDRIATFLITGHLSDPMAQLVPLRVHSGGLILLQSVPGDASNDSLVNLGDIVFVISYLYKNGPAPCVMESADVNGDCQVDLGDVVYLIGFLYRGGPPPAQGCAH